MRPCITLAVGLSLAVISVNPALPEAPASAPPSAGVTAERAAEAQPLVPLIATCLAEAVTQSAFRQDGNTIEFACFGEPAASLFARLARFDREERVTFKAGTFLVRHLFDATDEIMPDYCWQKLVEPDGAAASGFGCQLYYVAGRILGG
jgi:hypothetical protein